MHFSRYIYTHKHIYIYIHTRMHTRGFSFYRERLAFRYVETNLQVGKKDYYINNKKSLDDFATRFSNRLILWSTFDAKSVRHTREEAYQRMLYTVGIIGSLALTGLSTYFRVEPVYRLYPSFLENERMKRKIYKNGKYTRSLRSSIDRSFSKTCIDNKRQKENGYWNW